MDRNEFQRLGLNKPTLPPGNSSGDSGGAGGAAGPAGPAGVGPRPDHAVGAQPDPGRLGLKAHMAPVPDPERGMSERIRARLSAQGVGVSGHAPGNSGVMGGLRPAWSHWSHPGVWAVTGATGVAVASLAVAFFSISATGNGAAGGDKPASVVSFAGVEVTALAPPVDYQAHGARSREHPEAIVPVVETGATGRALTRLGAHGKALLEGRARAVVEQVDVDAAIVAVDAGRALFKAEKRPNRKLFRVDAGPVAVTVVGTVFSVEHTPQAVTVGVLEGIVKVSRGTRTDTLTAGQWLRYALSGGAPERGEAAPATFGFDNAAVTALGVEDLVTTQTAPASDQAAAGTEPAAKAPVPSKAATPRAHLERIEKVLAQPAVARVRAAANADAAPLTNAALRQLRDELLGLARGADEAVADVALFRAALVTGQRLNDPVLALALFREHASRFPQSTLSEESLWHALEGAAAAGVAPRDRVRMAEQFLARFGTSHRAGLVQFTSAVALREAGDAAQLNRAAAAFAEAEATLTKAQPGMAAEAAFWRAWSLHAARDFDGARAAWPAFVARYPDSPRRAEAEKALAALK
jgi:TolA-binding protein